MPVCFTNRTTEEPGWRSHVNAALVQELVRVYPEGCEHADGNGMLPLHRAAQYHPFEVVQLLLDAFPEGAQHPNKIGQLPLHFAAHGGAEVRV